MDKKGITKGPKFNYSGLLSVIIAILIPPVYFMLIVKPSFFTFVVIPTLPLIAIVFGIGGVIHSVISIKKYRMTGIWRSVLGIVLSILGIIGGALVALLILGLLNSIDNI